MSDVAPLLYCSGCGATKAAEWFSRNRSHKTGFANWCKACLKGLWQRPANKARRKERRGVNLQRTLFVECRSRAKRAGLPFDLDETDLEIPLICPVFGVPLVWTFGLRTDQTPTVDRVDPRMGYVKGNVAVISWRANMLKRDSANSEEFAAIAAFMRRAGL